MRLAVARELIRNVAERWKTQYCHDGQWGVLLSGTSEDTYQRLSQLDGQTASPKDVSDIIGNESWSNFFCSECCDYFPRIILFENHGDGDVAVCEKCLRLAVELLP